jgi:4-hydroxybenzoate polyprenyltransferase
MRISWDAYWRLMRFDRPIGILLLLWPTWWSLLLAGNGRPSVKNILIFTAGVTVMRAAGCVMNDIADRNYDPHVERTRNRPLARGELDLRQACVTFALLMIAALMLVLLTNRLTILLACVGALLAASYPFFKRFTHLPQVILGIAFGWGIPMAFAAETGTVPSFAWILLAVNIVWATIYDTFYAMVDRDDDRVVGVKSTAILFGRHDLFAVKLLMVIVILLLSFIGWHKQLHWPWFLGLAAVMGLFTWQQWVARGRDRASCFRAFKNNNWVGLVIFLGLAGHFIVANW